MVFLIVKSGDYSIQVHIIEARDLKAENLDGTSDPVCYIEMFGQKQNTSTKKSCTSCKSFYILYILKYIL